MIRPCTGVIGKKAMGAPQIVIAEDESSFRSLIAEMLILRNLKVLEAADGAETIDLLKDHPGVSLLLSDVRMPRMDGYALVETAQEMRPELKVLMMTAYVQDRPPTALLKAREIRTLTKPIDLDRLCDLVSEMLARP
jgi:DNA-binding NtrC family response regulator